VTDNPGSIGSAQTSWGGTSRGKGIEVAPIKRKASRRPVPVAYPPARSAGDDLLRWVSEAGSGSWERLRDACAFVAQKYALQRRPWTLASDLSVLGHLDIDWKSRFWSVAPPAINLVPGLGLCVVLTGSRPFYVDRRFEEATDDLEVFPFDVPQPPSPSAKFAKCASVDVAKRVAEGMGATLVVDPAGALASALRPVDEEPIEPAPEPALEEARRFDPVTLRWEEDHGRRPGLYRVDLHGRPVHRRLDGHASWWAIDLPAGQFLALQEERKEPVVRWQQPAGQCPACFDVRREVSLPVLAERAATVSSGLVPQVHGEWRRYLNVPRDLATQISSALLQTLPTTWED
jgi:hypothetical protein